MANFNAPLGIRPVKNDGTPFTGQGRMIAFPASQAVNIFLCDPLVPLGGTDAFGVPLVGIATAGDSNTILGGFIGICNGPAGSGFTVTRDLPVYRQASILNYGFISDDPNQLFVAQEDSVGGAISAASGGFANANLVAGAGNTVTGFSGWQIQSSSVATTATRQVRLLELMRGPDNVLGVNAKWLIRLNLPALWATTGY